MEMFIYVAVGMIMLGLSFLATKLLTTIKKKNQGE